MAGVHNHTARQLNLRAKAESGQIITVRLKPLMNAVPQDKWDVVKDDPYVKSLIESKQLTAADSAHGDAPEAVTKVSPAPKEKAAAKAPAAKPAAPAAK